MTRYAWLTDIHLEFFRSKETIAFVKELASQKLDGLFLTGDISTASKTYTNLPFILCWGTMIIMVVPLKQFEKWLEKSATNLNGSTGCPSQVLLHLEKRPA